MAQVYDIKAFDRDERIVMGVDFGHGMKFVDPKMDFYMEVLEENVEQVETIIELLQLQEQFIFLNRNRKDVDNRDIISLLYRTLEAKETLKKVCLENDIYLINADITEEFQWLLFHKHISANFLKNLLLFDIECDPTGFAFWDVAEEKDKYKNRIYSIGCIDLRGNERFFIEEDESVLLKKFYAYAKNYTAISGWNSRAFDVPILEGRTKRLGLRLDWSRFSHIDMMYWFGEWRNKTKELGDVVFRGLDKVAETYLGEGKIDVGGPEGIKKMWDEGDWLGMEIYCMNDVRLMYDLYYKIKGLRDIMNIEATKVELGYLNPNKRYLSAFVDNGFTRLAFEMGLAVPQKGLWQYRDVDVKTKGAGGLVPKAVKGLHFNIVSIDFMSLYPTIYMTHNIGVNTVDWKNEFEDSVKTEELSFRPEPKGLNAEFMRWLLETRKVHRVERDKHEKGTPEYENADILQGAFKSILVGANGVLEQEKFRYKNQAIYNSCTKTGQVYLKYLIEAVELLGWKLIEGDTDGLHAITLYDSVEEIVDSLEEAQEFIQDYVKKKAMERWNIPEELYAIFPRVESISSHFYCIKKKNYIRRIVWDDGKYLSESRFDAKGMPGVKYNTLPLLKEILKNVFKKVVFTVDRDTDYVTLAVDYLLRVKDDLFSGRRDDWLTFAQRVNKLGGRLPHDRAAAKLAEKGLFEPAKIIRFIRRANNDLILPDYDTDFRVDYETYNFWWTGTVSKWMKDLLPEVAADRALGFRVAAPTKKLDW